MKTNVILLDVGVLLTKDNEEFDYYASVYDHEYGYYDEDQTAYKESDLAKAIRDAKLYVVDGVDMTYAVITTQGQINYVGDTLETEWVLDDFTYKAEDVIFSVAKINGKIIEDFIRGTSKC